MKIYLRVPFSEKEDAKRLGARWDGSRKLWYIPEGMSRDLFGQWPDADVPSQPVSETSATPSRSTDQPLQLEQFLLQIQRLIQQHLPATYWVRGELAEIRMTVGGHLQLGLVEYDAQGRQTAKASAWIWKQDIQRIQQQFIQVAGGEIEAGMKLQLLLRPEFSPAFGFSLHISDIDPAYTLGDMAARLAMIRETLKQEGILHLNRTLPLPLEFCRVAVISPAAAAGLGDFRQSADPLHNAGVCAFAYYACRFQGKEAPAEILDALASVLEDHGKTPYDCVCIIRGGGAGVDLHWLNDLELAKALCLAPLPVLTGIGHERDQTILDEVSRMRFDTPSKVIGHISHIILNNVREAQKDMLSIMQKGQYQWQSALQAVNACHQQIQEYASMSLQRMDERTENLMGGLLQSAENQLQSASMRMDMQLQSLTQTMSEHLASGERQIDMLHLLVFERAGHLLQQGQAEIRALGESILGLGPAPVLKRGYAMIRNPQGHIISSVTEVRRHAQLSIEFHDGIIPLSIKETTP